MTSSVRSLGPEFPVVEVVVEGSMTDPATMELVDGDMAAQVRRVFDNLTAVAEAAGGSLADIAKLNIFLPDLGHFALVNEIMAEYFSEPYPARAAVGVASLPKGSQVEMDAVMELDSFDEDEYLDQ